MGLPFEGVRLSVGFGGVAERESVPPLFYRRETEPKNISNNGNNFSWAGWAGASLNASLTGRKVVFD